MWIYKYKSRGCCGGGSGGEKKRPQEVEERGEGEYREKGGDKGESGRVEMGGDPHREVEKWCRDMVFEKGVKGEDKGRT